MTLSVRSIAGLPGMPVPKQGVAKWLSAKGIAVQLDG